MRRRMAVALILLVFLFNTSCTATELTDSTLDDGLVADWADGCGRAGPGSSRTADGDALRTRAATVRENCTTTHSVGVVRQRSAIGSRIGAGSAAGALLWIRRRLDGWCALLPRSMAHAKVHGTLKVPWTSLLKLQNMAGNYQPLYFTGALANGHEAGVTIHALHFKLAAVTVAPMDLNGITTPALTHFRSK